MYWEEISEKKWNSGKMYRSWDVTDIAQEKTEHPVIYFGLYRHCDAAHSMV